MTPDATAALLEECTRLLQEYDDAHASGQSAIRMDRAQRAVFNASPRLLRALVGVLQQQEMQMEKIRRVTDMFDLPSSKADVVERVRDMGMALADSWTKFALAQTAQKDETT